MEMKREDYIKELRPGHIIAYKNEKGMYTGKVMSVYENEVVIQTVNKSIYTIDKQDITWIKLGSRWPTGIHNALIASKACTKMDGGIKK